MNPTEIAECYFASVRSRDIDAFMELFADDATLTLPDGRIVSGSAAIREMETEVFKSGAPMPNPVAIIASDDSVAVQIDVSLPNGSLLKMANFYHLNQNGKIQNLSVYRQSA